MIPRFPGRGIKSLNTGIMRIDRILMSKSALITGITGQDGSYLAELLVNKGYDVHGIVRRSSNVARTRIDDLDLDRSKLHLHYGDLGDSASLQRILYDIEPDNLRILPKEQVPKHNDLLPHLFYYQY